MADETPGSLVSRARKELSEYRTRPVTRRAEETHAQLLADLLAEFIQEAEDRPLEYGFTGSDDPNGSGAYVHDVGPDRASIERLWGPEMRNELHLGKIVARTAPGLWFPAPPLDPTPWRYDLFPRIPDFKRPREAEQITGGFTFAPRPGYSQHREDYR
jgi:hypothetical protein